MRNTYVPTYECEEALKQIGSALRTARQRRRETEVMAAERVGVSRATYQRMESGDPSVSAGAMMEALLLYGFRAQVFDLGNPDADGVGKRLERQQLPKKGKTHAA